MINDTHNPRRRSWVESANQIETDFPIQNLPLGVFRISGRTRCGVAIGNQILDLAAADLLQGTGLNDLMQHGRPAWVDLREAISETLREGSPEHPEWLVPQSEAEMLMPARIGDFTDFYASIHHARNVGALFRPDNPLLSNYKHMPIAYHGRASSIVLSGTQVRRPYGQTTDDGNDRPSFGPSKRLDYELELGFYVGPGNTPGEPIPIEFAEDHIFGLCLVNDWSARDIQRWEYQPLGPFLSKSFATSISPWIVTNEALAPFREPAPARPPGDPEPLPYLLPAGNSINISLEVSIQSSRMREMNLKAHRVSRGSSRQLFWTLEQMLTHHTSNGCKLRPGDLMATGTISGPTPESRGCLLELQQVELPSGEKRCFLQDGDEVIFNAWAERDGFTRIGLGECRGRIAG